MPPATSPQSLILVTGEYRLLVSPSVIRGHHASSSESFGRVSRTGLSISVQRQHTDNTLGASGFLGAWIIHTLLRRDYRVRAAVRSSDTANDLKALFEQHTDDLEFAVVEDIFKA